MNGIAEDAGVSRRTSEAAPQVSKTTDSPSPSSARGPMSRRTRWTSRLPPTTDPPQPGPPQTHRRPLETFRVLAAGPQGPSIHAAALAAAALLAAARPVASPSPPPALSPAYVAIAVSPPITLLTSSFFASPVLIPLSLPPLHTPLPLAPTSPPVRLNIHRLTAVRSVLVGLTAARPGPGSDRGSERDRDRAGAGCFLPDPANAPAEHPAVHPKRRPPRHERH